MLPSAPHLYAMHQTPGTPRLRDATGVRCCLRAGLAVSTIAGVAVGAALAGAAAVAVAWALLLQHRRRQQPSAATLFPPSQEGKDGVSPRATPGPCLVWTAWRRIFLC